MSPEMVNSVSAVLVREAITKIREKERELEFAARYGGGGYERKKAAIEARIEELTAPLIEAMILCESATRLLRSIRDEINKTQGWRPNDFTDYSALVECLRNVSTAITEAKVQL